MNAKTRKIKIRIASQSVSLSLKDRVARDWNAREAAAIELPDGHCDAIRVRLDAGTGQPAEANGRISICAPWLLSGTFGSTSSPLVLG